MSINRKPTMCFTCTHCIRDSNLLETHPAPALQRTCRQEREPKVNKFSEVQQGDCISGVKLISMIQTNSFQEANICSPEQGSAETESKLVRLMDQKVSVTAIQLCHCLPQQPQTLLMNGHGWVANKTLFIKTGQPLAQHKPSKKNIEETPSTGIGNTGNSCCETTELSLELMY